MTESSGLEGASKDAQVQTPAQTWSTIDDCSSWVLNIIKDGNSTTFLGNLFQCWIACSVKKCSLTSREDFLNLNLCPLALVSLGTTERRLVLLCSPHWVFRATLVRPLSLLYCRLNSPSPLRVPSYKQCSSPLWPFAGLQ